MPAGRASEPRPAIARGALAALCAATFALGALAGSSAVGQRRARPQPAPVPNDRPAAPANETACNYQEPQGFLIRETFVARFTASPEERRAREEAHARAIRYRTEQYGYFEGFGQPAWNEHPPIHYAERIAFMGKTVRVNAKIVPALRCVEEQLRAECGATPYQPQRLSGIRTTNTYHNGEVSNHVYGIAVDVDPTLNTCCMCVAQWGDHPLCQRPVESIYDRMAMPSCWVHVFERFGFHWLGRDRLQDTMHFEFLGDPGRIQRER